MGIDIVLFDYSSSDGYRDTITEDTPNGEDQPECSEDGEQDKIPGLYRLDPAYSADSTSSPTWPQLSDTLEELNPLPVDVDRCESIFIPDEYLRRFKDTLSPVQLIN